MSKPSDDPTSPDWHGNKTTRARAQVSDSKPGDQYNGLRRAAGIPDICPHGCKVSDAWRCARDRQDTRHIACACECHQYILNDKSAYTDEDFERLLSAIDDDGSLSRDVDILAVEARRARARKKAWEDRFEAIVGEREPDAAGNRVIVLRDLLKEWYDSEPNGSLNGMPPQPGSLILRTRLALEKKG